MIKLEMRRSADEPESLTYNNGRGRKLVELTDVAGTQITGKRSVGRPSTRWSKQIQAVQNHAV